ncbi:hypothetical protein PV396_07580 [Streptomyces sp. ME02-8801-2C]|uniref:hypothetical protein n=1 Tax=Streptomyces sp. ME02-8801-2C TaxID=3028680 RepID=UPI0029BB81BB|nr:hypothetical protein [Streptomyces sp. ME02-8801-2C]MDX3451808.1 hypothetical protein [Streptomyces sp. ME02-8801-2C]
MPSTDVVRVLQEYGPGRDEQIDRPVGHGIGTSVHFVPMHCMPYFQRTALTPPGGLPGVGNRTSRPRTAMARPYSEGL